MYTCVIYREEDEVWIADSDCRTSPSRIDIVYSPNLDDLKAKLIKASEACWDDMEEKYANYPEYHFLYNGVPVEDLGLVGLSDTLQVMTKEVEGQMQDYLAKQRQIKAQQANEERLERERKAKSALEIQERDELARLMAKYG